MIQVAANLFVILLILVVAEYAWRRKILRAERARKAIHISVGTFVAFWPWMMSWRTIQLISLAFLIAVIFTRRYQILRSIYFVKRRTYGEELFAIAVGLCALLTTNKAIFTIAILHMALADGLAAVVGQRVHKKWRFEVFGQQKTLIGSFVFCFVSVWVIGLGLIFSVAPLNLSPYIYALVVIPPAATALELLSPYGLDNIVIPLFVLGSLEILI